MPRSSRAEAARTRDAIVSEFVADASRIGLDGVTLGALADRLEMSKAGVLGPFGTKEALQLAALERAGDVFTEVVWGPASAAERGLPRLEAIIDAWLAYLDGDVFPGGCFLTQAAADWDGRPGAVHDAVVTLSRRWLKVLEREVAVAVEHGELEPGTDPAQVAFELNAIAQGVNQAIQLRAEADAAKRGRAAMLRALQPRRG